MRRGCHQKSKKAQKKSEDGKYQKNIKALKIRAMILAKFKAIKSKKRRKYKKNYLDLRLIIQNCK